MQIEKWQIKSGPNLKHTLDVAYILICHSDVFLKDLPNFFVWHKRLSRSNRHSICNKAVFINKKNTMVQGIHSHSHILFI